MKKKYGQNFLTNGKIINKIINIANINEYSNILEIGPGDGALSKQICKKKPKKYIAVEIDKTLRKSLSSIFSDEKYQLIYEDALKFKEQDYFLKNTTLISNLPYNISIPLLIKWTYQLEKSPWYKKMILMFQKEVAERILSKENSKKFGRITLLTSAFFKITKIIDVNKSDFYPIPKVDSIVLLFEPLKKKMINFNEIKSLELLSHEFFNNRRKKLKKKITKLFDEEVIKKNSLDKLYDLRAENLNKFTFYKLVKLVNSDHLQPKI